MPEMNPAPQLPQQNQEELYRQLNDYVIERFRAGDSKAAVIAKLVDQKIQPALAEQIVTAIFESALVEAKREQMTGDEILPAIGGGLLASIIGGLIWGGVVLATNYEIGYMAWGLGLLSGYTVHFFASGKKGLPLQVIAVVSSLLGIFIGKYFVFYESLKNALNSEFGAGASGNLKFFSSEVINFFFKNIGSMLSGHDAIWVILAVITAWSMLQKSGVKTAD